MYSPGSNDLHQIRPGLWLGSVEAAKDRKALAARGITHVVTLGETLPRYMGITGTGPESSWPNKRMRVARSREDPFERLLVSVLDCPTEPLSKHWSTVSNFVSEALEKPGNGVIVHCHAGVSRGASTVAQHLMRTEGLTAAQALDDISSKRTFINPNDGFLRQLCDLESQLGHSRPRADQVSTPARARSQGREPCPRSPVQELLNPRAASSISWAEDDNARFEKAVGLRGGPSGNTWADDEKARFENSFRVGKDPRARSEDRELRFGRGPELASPALSIFEREPRPRSQDFHQMSQTAPAHTEKASGAPWAFAGSGGVSVGSGEGAFRAQLNAMRTSNLTPPSPSNHSHLHPLSAAAMHATESVFQSPADLPARASRARSLGRASSPIQREPAPAFASAPQSPADDHLSLRRSRLKSLYHGASPADTSPGTASWAEDEKARFENAFHAGRDARTQSQDRELRCARNPEQETLQALSRPSPPRSVLTETLEALSGPSSIAQPRVIGEPSSPWLSSRLQAQDKPQSLFDSSDKDGGGSAPFDVSPTKKQSVFQEELARLTRPSRSCVDTTQWKAPACADDPITSLRTKTSFMSDLNDPLRRRYLDFRQPVRMAV